MDKYIQIVLFTADVELPGVMTLSKTEDATI